MANRKSKVADRKSKRSGKAPAASERDNGPFPRPANPDQRYSPDTPWLAIVNAKGPKGLWLHKKPAPAWQPWCTDLFDPNSVNPKSRWFQTLDYEGQFFIFALWRLAAMLDLNGIIWGESESLRRQMRMPSGKLITDRAKFNAYLEAYAKAGFICFLSDAEKEAAERLIFAKQKGQDRTGQDSKEQESTEPGPGSGVIVSDSANPSSRQTTGQQSKSTAQDQATGTAAGPGPAPAAEPASSQKPEAGCSQASPPQPQKLEAEGPTSGRAPEGPRIDAPLHPIEHPSNGAKPQGQGRAAARQGRNSEPSRLGDISLLMYNDELNLSFGCQMHNATHRGACIFPGTREQRNGWSADVWSDVTAWINLFCNHIRGRPDELERVQSCFRYAEEQRSRKKPPRNLAGATRAIINRSFGIVAHQSRAGPA